MAAPPAPAVYDSGALIAADRNDDRLRALHSAYLRHGLAPYLPAPVLTQVWRDGARQARLSMVLRGCELCEVDEPIAKQAGVLLGRSGTADAVDAIVVATAVYRRALIVTSDPQDIRKLVDAVPSGPRPVLISL